MEGTEKAIRIELRALSAATVSAQRINEVLEAIPEVQDAPDALPLPDSIRPRLAFDGVSFHYNGATDQPGAAGHPLDRRPAR